MSSESTTNIPLQFETAVPAVTGNTLLAANAVMCGSCQQSLIDEYYDVNGVSICDRCRGVVVEATQGATGTGVMVKALAWGTGAAIVGAILYYAVAAIANLEIGLVAIAIGYMVGYAIRRAAGGRGARSLQVLAVVLTYWSVGLAYTPLVIQASREADKADTSSGAVAGSKTAGTSSPEDSSFVGAMAYLFAFTFALPVIVVVGSLPSGAISALIIGFGMHKAWQMTSVPHLQILGPFQITTPAAPVA